MRDELHSFKFVFCTKKTKIEYNKNSQNVVFFIVWNIYIK